MDTMKLLLGATVALLLGALAVSWQGMKTGVKNAPSDEIARLEKQVRELRAEQDKLRMEKDIQQIRNTPAIEAAPSSELAAMRRQLEVNKLAVEELALKKEKEARDAKVADQEELLIEQRELGKRDPEFKRANMISQALLIGKVKEYVEDAALGGFITFEVLMPEQVQTGTVLAIRRKTGLLGQLKVSDITPEGAVANPLPGFGPVKPVAGDELILPPQY
jgi:ribosomal protein L29